MPGAGCLPVLGVQTASELDHLATLAVLVFHKPVHQIDCVKCQSGVQLTSMVIVTVQGVEAEVQPWKQCCVRLHCSLPHIYVQH